MCLSPKKRARLAPEWDQLAKDSYFYGESFVPKVLFLSEKRTTHAYLRFIGWRLFYAADVLGYVRYTIHQLRR